MGNQGKFTKKQSCKMYVFLYISALDLTALSHIKQTTLSSSGEKKNMLGKTMRSLPGRVAQSTMSKSIGATQFM